MTTAKREFTIHLKRTRRVFGGERFTFTITAPNGETVVPPERYHRRQAAEDTVNGLAEAKFTIVDET